MTVLEENLELLTIKLNMVLGGWEFPDISQQVLTLYKLKKSTHNVSLVEANKKLKTLVLNSIVSSSEGDEKGVLLCKPKSVQKYFTKPEHKPNCTQIPDYNNKRLVTLK